MEVIENTKKRGRGRLPGTTPPKTSTERGRDFRRRRSDLGPRLEEARAQIDVKRRESCRKSFWKFISTYCCGDGGFFSWLPYAETRTIVETMQKAADAGVPYHIRMTRGGGKTSLMLALIAYRICYGLSHYVVISASVKPQATVMLEDVWSLFENGEEIGQDFPEICLPVRALEGSAQKAISQHIGGKRTCIKRSDKFIYLPTVEGSAASGAILTAVGFDGKVRGLRKGKLRPDLVLLDDLQDDEMAASAEQVLKARQKIAKSYLGLGSAQHKVNVLMTSTPIAVNDLSEQFAEDPNWITQTFPLMWSLPKRQDLWKEYGRLKQAAVAEGNLKSTAPLEYYKAHFTEMNECPIDPATGKSGPLWAKCYDASAGEISPVQHAMNILYGPDGDRLFPSEYEMRPKRPSGAYEIDYREVLNSSNGLAPFTVPDQCSRLVATIDVMKNAGLRWVVAAAGAERVVGIVAYGRYPASGEPLFRTKDSFAEQDAKVGVALEHLVSDLKTRTFRSADGKRAYRIGAIGIDSGWKTRPVYALCARHHECLALKGMSWESFAPRSAGGKLKTGVVDATDWAYEKQVAYEPFTNQTFVVFHADYWRETMQRSFFSPPLQPNSISVCGDKADNMQFAQEVVADRLISKDQTKAGVGIWKWDCQGANHLGDCTTMALAVLHWKHAYSAGGSDQTAIVRREPVETPKAAPTPGMPAQRPHRRRSIMCL